MTIANDFLIDVLKHMEGVSTPILNITHIVFTTKYDVPSAGETLSSDNREIGRVAVTSKNRSGTTLTIEHTLTGSIANCLNTTVSGATSATVFNLTSVTGLAIGDRIQIQLVTGNVERKIIGLSGFQITIDQPLTSTPPISTIVRQMISRKAIVCNGTVTALSGTVLNWDSYIRYKDSQTAFQGRHVIKFKGAVT